MGKKDKLIAVLKNLNKKDIAHTVRECRICNVMHIESSMECRPCPFATKSEHAGCYGFIQDEEHMIISNDEFVDKKEEVLNILKDISKERFTKRGWKYFEELEHLKIDKKIPQAYLF